MPDDIIISELTNAPQIDDSAVFPLTQDNAGSPATFKATMSEIAGKVAEGTTFVNLETTAKTLVGAINEVNAGGGGGSADIISTASGTIATFNDGGNNIPVKSLVTEIVAVQAGTGTPSPSNVRPITGFDTVVITNKDDLDNPTTTDTHTITLPETIYGGTAELVGGNGTKTHGYVEFDGSNDESWNMFSVAEGNLFRIQNIGNKILTPTNALCDQYNVVDSANRANLTLSNASAINMDFINNSYSTVAEWRTALANNPVHVAFELATPTTFTTTPEEITTLSGVNNIYSNTGDVEVEYFNENANQMAELIRVMTR